jgi:hypothetical protein
MRFLPPKCSRGGRHKVRKQNVTLSIASRKTPLGKRFLCRKCGMFWKKRP